MTARVVLLGGPFDRHRATLSALAERISIQGNVNDPGEPSFYQRVDDPDTGAPLGAYVWEGAPRELVAVSPNR
jgi:hypothetical protein